MGKHANVVLYSVLIILLLMLTACGHKDESSDPLPSETPGDRLDQEKGPEGDTSIPEDRKNADYEVEPGSKAEDASKSKNAPADQGEVNVWITGEATVNEKTITVSGQTNLLPGSSINGDISAKGYTVFGYNDKSTVEPDGHFAMEIKKPKVQGRADIMIYFRPSAESESVQEVYGAAGEQLEGPYVYRYEEAGEIRRQKGEKLQGEYVTTEQTNEGALNKLRSR
ncbi:hypothetical protein [Paenibacillus sp. J2TS4]|uniref:hypothetical protein n=1 Tax=Paenibacillus sp. J2TS4 TaxID=2807194 RepID=UPI001BCB4F7E|nr:hypothetical protein [Paenibacillus sp. J2TS4]